MRQSTKEISDRGLTGSRIWLNPLRATFNKLAAHKCFFIFFGNLVSIKNIPLEFETKVYEKYFSNAPKNRYNQDFLITAGIAVFL
jgi:hypothetical protein